MSFLNKIFGRKSTESVAAPESTDPAKDPNMIRVFDAYGREMFITKQQWRDSVLVDHIKKVWSDPEALAATVIHSLKDGFVADMLKPAEHLATIDPNAERGATVLAIVYREVKRLDDSERVLRRHIERHGESGVVLTNLAKAYADRGDDERSMKTLWRALELDPNQENGLGWYDAIHREKDGPSDGRAALRRIAALPGSWRARLWLARDALKERQLDQALQLYDEAIAMAPRPAPTDLLQQISGDLGNHGHLPESLRLTSPLFDIDAHGLAVGNNLIKANLDLGRVDEARALIDRHYALKRPDWKEALSFWDTELAKVQIGSTSAPSPGDISVVMLTIAGPIWLPEQSPAHELFPAPVGELSRIAFLGGTAKLSASGDKPTHQLSDAPGRLSRSLPLYLAERVHFGSLASVRTIVPWLQGDNPAFVLSGVPWENGDAAQHGRTGPEPCDYVVVTHLRVAGDPWHVDLRLIRTIDGTCVATATASFDPAGPMDALPKLSSELLHLLERHAEVALTKSPAFYQVPAASDFPYYLLRLEQLLAVRCSSMDGVPAGFLNGEREILDGNLQLCLNHPVNVTTRVLFFQTMQRMQKIRPQAVDEFRERVLLLQKEKPLPSVAHGVLQRMVTEIYP